MPLKIVLILSVSVPIVQNDNIKRIELGLSPEFAENEGEVNSPSSVIGKILYCLKNKGLVRYI